MQIKGLTISFPKGFVRKNTIEFMLFENTEKAFEVKSTVSKRKVVILFSEIIANMDFPNRSGESGNIVFEGNVVPGATYVGVSGVEKDSAEGRFLILGVIDIVHFLRGTEILVGSDPTGVFQSITDLDGFETLPHIVEVFDTGRTNVGVGTGGKNTVGVFVPPEDFVVKTRDVITVNVPTVWQVRFEYVGMKREDKIFLADDGGGFTFHAGIGLDDMLKKRGGGEAVVCEEIKLFRKLLPEGPGADTDGWKRI